MDFHRSCLALDTAAMPNTWYCPHCSRLPQFKRRKNVKLYGQSSATNQAALLCDTICICKSKATLGEKLLECHGTDCKSSKFFHLKCLGFKRMPNNYKTIWQCAACKRPDKSDSPPTTCASSANDTSSSVSATVLSTSTSCITSDSDSDSEDEIEIIKETEGKIDKQGTLANLADSDYQIILDANGWLNFDIIQQAQVFLHNVNTSIEGFQHPTLGPVRNFDVVTTEFIQILHTGSDHWVCISSIACSPGLVNLYDSLYHDVISQEVEEQTDDLLGGNLIKLHCVPVQQQTNSSDCGVFAIAFACCLAFGRDSSHVTFDVSLMRFHLAACFRSKTMSMFPCF